MNTITTANEHIFAVKNEDGSYTCHNFEAPNEYAADEAAARALLADMIDWAQTAEADTAREQAAVEAQNAPIVIENHRFRGEGGGGFTPYHHTILESKGETLYLQVIGGVPMAAEQSDFYRHIGEPLRWCKLEGTLEGSALEARTFHAKLRREMYIPLTKLEWKLLEFAQAVASAARYER